MRTLLALAFALVGLCVSAPADMLPTNEAPKVHVELIPDRDAVRPGSTFTIAVAQDITAGWHTYWRNPGEAGQATEVKWSLPQGWKAGALQWPYPIRIPVGPLMDYGYEGKVWLLVDVTVPSDAKTGTVTFEGLAQYLVCREVCVPEDAKVQVTMVVDPNAAGPAASTAADFAAARAKLPAASPWPVRYGLSQDLRLFVEAPALATGARPVDVQFFPAETNLVVDAAPQTASYVSNGLVLQLKPGSALAKKKALDGVLVLVSSDKSVQAINIHAAPGVVPSAATNGDVSFWLALVFAALGGLILNIMPCVLPVLAMKALALAGHAGADRAHARAEAFAYAAGAILSFVAFGLLVMALRAGGAAIGWGFQLQEPVVVITLALLMVAVGLNMSGVFEISPVSAGDSLARRGGLVGAFFTGVLAVAVAAPCTAPFMATAIGYSFTQDAGIVIGIFTALGIGFALPFILLGLWPAMHKLLPKPGAWMSTLKKILALPMYAAAAWLVWVLAKQVDRSGLIAALAAVACLVVVLWAYGRLALASGWKKSAAWIAIIVFFVAGLVAVRLTVTAAAPVAVTAGAHAGMASEPYTPARLAELRKEGRPVFVDATASWCITCLVNEEAALARPSVHAAFKDKHIALLVADWTNRNPEITALLERHGRSGVPLYLYYAPGAAEPKILPQILTEGEVLAVLNGQ